MKKSIVEDKILSRDFAYLQPWFYDHPYAVRCELGIGDDNDEYLRAAKRRAMEIYRILFPNGADALFFDYSIYDSSFSGGPESREPWAEDLDEIYEYSIKQTVTTLKFLQGFQRRYRHVVVKDLDVYADDEADDDIARRNRVVCYPDGDVFEAEALICNYIDEQIEPEVGFVSFGGEFIFSVYDDRGCDVVFATPEAYAANYHRLEPYFPDHDRELMETRYREATEELPKTEDSPNERR